MSLPIDLCTTGIGSAVLRLGKRILQLRNSNRTLYRSGSRPSSPVKQVDVNEGQINYIDPGNPNEPLPILSVPLQATLAVTHMVATLTTNASIAFATPAPAFIIKAFEPITTAILAAIVGGKRVETHVIISLPLVA